MTRCGSTGATAPAWIRETVRRYEDAWPPLVLAALVGAALLIGLCCGGLLWISDAPVYYALP